MPSVFLIGFMASGKTTVGRELARDGGLPFVDLDAAIEEAAGMTVRGIFAAEGEAGFRAREAAALDAVLAAGDAIVATGGGTPCAGDAMQRMRDGGAVVALTAPFERLMERVEDPSVRPLLAQPREQTRALLEARMSVYRQAHFGVATEDRDAAAVAARVRAGVDALALLPDAWRSRAAVVSLADRSYPIAVAPGALDSLGAVIECLGECLGERLGAATGGYTAAGIVTDDNVAPLYLDRARSALASAGLPVCHAVVPAGEPSKQLATAGTVAAKLVAGGLDRGSVVIALGGGVVGDLAGFVAATLFRGVAVVQVPTTLLAMIDSAIGGKTGVDLPAGKNLVGAFWQPDAVIADTDTLATLPAREMRAATGELVKYGLLDGEPLLSLCETADAADPELIRRCAAYKAWVVSRDERERTGERALLNLGHTVGHAIEAAAGYGTLLHGECVALGLIAACRVSRALTLCDDALESRVVSLLRARGLDVDLDRWLTQDVLSRIGVDKKRVGSNIRFVALERPGVPRVEILPLDQLSEILYD
jgi:3-dehydroquinate synthase